MVKAATRILRKNPKYITFMAPAVTYIFTIFAYRPASPIPCCR